MSKVSKLRCGWIACVFALCLTPLDGLAYELELTPRNQFHVGEGQFDFVYLPDGQSAYAKKLDATVSSIGQYTNSRFTIFPETGDLARVESIEVDLSITHLDVGGGRGCLEIYTVTPFVPVLTLCDQTITHTASLKTNVLYQAQLAATVSVFPGEHFAEVRFQLPAEVRAESISAGLYHTCRIRSDATLACFGEGNQGQTSPPAGNFSAVSAGHYHDCGVRTDGTLACWGYNEQGQATPPPGSFKTVGAGKHHSCGVRSNGALACWGDDAYGRATPPIGAFRTVSVGADHNCAIRTDRSLACWGDDGHGQATPPPGAFIDVGVGSSHSCGVRSNGELACWGFNYFGSTAPPAGQFVAISADSYFSCAVRTSGELACWGSNPAGETAPPSGPFAFVSAGGSHGCGVRSEGTVACWGYNGFGQAPQLEIVPSTLPNPIVGAAYSHQVVLVDTAGDYAPYSPQTPAFVLVAGSLPPGLDLSAGGSLSGAPTVAGSFSATIEGEDANGFAALRTYVLDVADTTPPDTLSPETFITAQPSNPSSETDAAFAFSGDDGGGSGIAGFSCSLDGAAFADCLSPKTFVSLAPGEHAFSVAARDVAGNIDATPATVAWVIATAPDIETLSAGLLHTCRIRTDGSLGCWGYNPHGAASPPAGGFASVSAGYVHSCALRGDGQLSCWGNNSLGQSSPPAGTFVAVSAGNEHTCAVRSDGALACWGKSIGSPPSGTFVAVSSRADFSCAIRTSGALACWGFSAVQAVPPSGSFIDVSVSQNHSCAVRSDGSLACWGYDAFGVLSPPAGAFIAVGSGFEHACAIRADETLACWGRSIGSAPPGAFIEVSSGESHSCALRGNGTTICWGDDRYGQAPRPTVLPAIIPGGVANAQYAQAVGMVDAGSASGDFPYASPAPGFGVVSGTLPPGIDLSAAGLLSGVPTSAGSFSFAIEGEDGNGFVARRSYALGIVPATIDNTPPVILPTISGPLGNNGWYTGDITISWSISDAQSEITDSTGCTTTTLTSDLPATIFSCSATSQGGTSGKSITVKRDATAPILNPQVTAIVQLNGTGSISANASDGMSGLAEQSCTPLDTSVIGTHTSQCTASDLAGNTSAASVTYSVVDGSPPVIVPSISGTQGDGGWYRSSVTVSWGVSDGESSISSTSGCAATTLSADSLGAVYTCSATSSGGTTTKSVSIKIDRTAPAISPSVSPNPLLLNANVSGQANASDATSGVVEQQCQALQTSSVGNRTSTCTAKDAAGNSASASLSYRVIYGFTGFTAPLASTAVYFARELKLVPFRWRLTDANGQPVTNLTSASIATKDKLGVARRCTKDPSVGLAEYGKGSAGLRNLGNGYYEYDFKGLSGTGPVLVGNIYYLDCHILQLRLTELGVSGYVYGSREIWFYK